MRQARMEARLRERLDAKKAKKQAAEIEPIDQNEDYVVPAGFEVGADDLALFDQLEKLNVEGSLERNVAEFKKEAARKSPAADPEVAEVYQKWLQKNRGNSPNLPERKAATFLPSGAPDGVLGRPAGTHQAGRVVAPRLL